MNNRLVPAILLSVLFLTGCAAKKQPAAAMQAAGPEPGSRADLIQLIHQREEQEKQPEGTILDARPDVAIGIRLEIWHLKVPQGTISRSTEFWKHIDEDCIDVATRDLLLKNGMRVGQAATAEWEYFRKLIEDQPATSQMTVFKGTQGESIDLEMAKNIDLQDLLYYDSQNVMIGRTFDHSDNLMSLSFHAAPRKLGQVRITLCPVVRSTRKRLEVSVLNEEREIAFVKPERLYDCNLRVDVPIESFLIVSPANDAAKTSIGRAFLFEEGATERVENVLLIVPQPYAMDAAEKAMAAGQGPLK